MRLRTQRLLDAHAARDHAQSTTDTALDIGRELADQRDQARDMATRLEGENAELYDRCRALILLWVQEGSVLHASQLNEAIDLACVPVGQPA